MINRGDKLKYTAHPFNPVGQITAVDYMNSKFTIEWDDPSLIPPKDVYQFDDILKGHFEVIHKTTNINFMSVMKCECGVDTLGYGKHSDYCPKWIYFQY